MKKARILWSALAAVTALALFAHGLPARAQLFNGSIHTDAYLK